MIFIIFWKYTVIAEINHVGQYWKKDTGLTTKFITTPISIPTTASETTSSVPLITTPLKIKVTFENPLMQWTFPIDIGTPPQNLNILIDVTTNLLWVTSELCTNPFGDACYNRTTNFFNTSFTNTITSDDEEFKFKYIQRELISIWVNDTIKFNNQIFEEMQIGLPKDVNGSENFVIPDTVSGQIGIMPYQNKQIVGIAFSMNSTDIGLGGTITFGGIDLDHIQGNNESNIVYQPLPQLTDPNKLFTILLIYLLKLLVKNGEYPSSAISKNSVNDPNQCESAITGGANDGIWIFGRTFITNFYMVFDQTNLQFGIALRSDINYGPPPGPPPPDPPAIMIQLPKHYYSGDSISTGYMKIVNDQFGSQTFTVENKTDPDGFYHVEAGGAKNSETCSAESAEGIAYLAVTPQLKGSVTAPWKITIRDYSVGLKIRVPDGTKTLEIDRLDVPKIGSWTLKYFNVFNVDNDGYFHLNDDYIVYNGYKYDFYAYSKPLENSTSCDLCTEQNQICGVLLDLVPDLAINPWAVVLVMQTNLGQAG
ncbi:aspartic peptidase domain-containing protein [Gigaspora rosea]|uniref:Aspartic peptidase domain-containing protein n=1 Tax=Gigaspora rosea TaxID=44941 RepID=A0A397UWX5_9GLOM|nr:aspartic peptidase domain-containing protein [Gigaspora rosea]